MTGAFKDWIGYVFFSSPTGGGTGCSGLYSQLTPGWCVGGGVWWTGNAVDIGNGAFNNPRGIDISPSGSTLYVADYANNRVSRFNAISGAFRGWIGKISTSPTGGDKGCKDAAVGTVTPGWCLGGTPAEGSGDGEMSYPASGLTVQGTQLYVPDTTNNRIIRFNIGVP